MRPQVDIIVYFTGIGLDYKLERDFGLYLRGCTYKPPEAKTAYVSVPGRDGDLDFTEALSGGDGTVHYGNAELDMTFELAWTAMTPAQAATLASMTGHRADVTISGGVFSGYQYHGRLTVGDLTAGEVAGSLSIQMNVERKTVIQT